MDLPNAQSPRAAAPAPEDCIPTAGDPERFARIVEVLPNGITILDSTGRITFANRAAEKILGLSADEIVTRRYDTPAWNVTTIDGQPLEPEGRPFARVMRTGATVYAAEFALVRADGTRIFVSIDATPLRSPSGEITGVGASLTDITGRKRDERFLEARNQVLETIASGAPIAQTLDLLVRRTESLADGMRCSLLLLDDDGVHVRHGAAPSLPAAFVEAIDGQPIGPSAGSCGAAAWRAEQVIVEDILTDPLWNDYRAVATAHGLRACWSTPIVSSERKVLGTFAMYYHEPRAPLPHEQRLIEVATHLAAISIEQRRAIDALRESEARYRDLYDSASDLILIVGPDMALRFVNAAFRTTMGYEPADGSRLTLLEILHPEKRDICLETFRRVTSGEHTDRIDASFVTRAGERIEVEGSCSCSFRDGQLVTVRGIFRDVTARRAAEAERSHLLELERAARAEADAAHERTAQVLESVSDAFISLDSEWRFTYVNEKAAQLLRRKCGDLLGKNIWTEFPEAVAEPFERAFHHAMTERTFVFIEEYYPPFDCWFENRIYPARDGISVFFHDITDRKRAEQKIAEQLDELRRWQQLTLGREDRVRELKREVNELRQRLGDSPAYEAGA